MLLDSHYPIPSPRCRRLLRTHVYDLYEACGDRKEYGSFGLDDRTNHREELYHTADQKVWERARHGSWKMQTDEPCNASLSLKEATHFMRSVES